MAEAFDFFAQDVEDAHFRDVVVIFDNKVVIGRVGENFEVSSLRSKLCTYGFISNYSRIRITVLKLLSLNSCMASLELPTTPLG